jgi:hypothetical protein
MRLDFISPERAEGSKLSPNYAAALMKNYKTATFIS